MASEYSILLTEGAEQDLGAIYDYIAEFDDPAQADHGLDRLTATAEQLAIMPARGSYPRELLDLGIKDYRQVFFKPYRLIYRVMGRDVVVFVIADGRRARRCVGACYDINQGLFVDVRGPSRWRVKPAMTRAGSRGVAPAAGRHDLRGFAYASMPSVGTPATAAG